MKRESYYDASSIQSSLFSMLGIGHEYVAFLGTDGYYYVKDIYESVYPVMYISSLDQDSYEEHLQYYNMHFYGPVIGYGMVYFLGVVDAEYQVKTGTADRKAGGNTNTPQAIYTHDTTPQKSSITINPLQSQQAALNKETRKQLVAQAKYLKVQDRVVEIQSTTSRHVRVRLEARLYTISYTFTDDATILDLKTLVRIKLISIYKIYSNIYFTYFDLPISDDMLISVVHRQITNQSHFLIINLE